MQKGFVTISDKWQVVIPKRVREKVEIERKDKAIVFPVDSHRVKDIEVIWIKKLKVKK